MRRCGTMWAKAVLGAIAAGLAAGQADASTTITLDATIRAYFAPQAIDPANFGNPTPPPAYIYSQSSPFGSTYAIVGFRMDHDTYDDASLVGRYAATLDFTLPDLPDGAVITSASLQLADLTHYGGTVLVKHYVAPSSIFAPARVLEGSDVTTFRYPDGSGYAPIDVTSQIAADVVDTSFYKVAGFSFRQIVDDCARPWNGYAAYGVCNDTIGDTFTTADIPTLSITYDIPVAPPPASDVPEPSSWWMMIAGFGLTGGALRYGNARYRRSPQSAFA